MQEHIIIENDSIQRRISLSEYKGNYYINFREYFRADDNMFHPTKKGVVFAANVENIDKIIAALNEIKNEILGI